eukprot:6779927-Heterocapsa_arctica.AAC.1
MMRRDRYSKEDVVNTWSPPPSLQGRGGAARIRSRHGDVTIVALYFPPRVTAAKDTGAYRKTVDALINWAREVILQVPMRSMVALGCDLNDNLSSKHLNYAAQ